MASQHDSKRIIDWKSRRGRGGRNYRPSTELDSLLRAWNENSENLGAFRDFIPIRLVTIIEVFVRDAVREAVDRGPPYIDRAERLVKGTKIDFLFAQNIQGKHISLGDIVAYSLSTNDITQILATFETLFPNFRTGICEVYDRVEVEIYGKPKRPIIGDIDQLVNYLAKLFTARHIATHELPVNAPYDLVDMPEFLRCAKEFIDATQEYLTNELDGHVPLTQTEMTEMAYDSLDKAERELEEVLTKVEELEGIDLNLLKMSQQKWNEFALADAEFEASTVAGGSMGPMIFAGSKESLVRIRIDDLRKWIEREEGEIS